MAHCISHEPCPKCRSKDNRGVYDDGSEWCFGCGYYVPPQGIMRVQRALRKAETIEAWGDLRLPKDVTYRLEDKHLTWLRKYALTTTEIIQFRFMSSPTKGLILPIFNQSDEVLFYVNRPFKEGIAKSFDNGRKPFLVLPPRREHRHPETCIIVEDFISAVKVSRYYNCLPLFGSHLGVHTIERLRKRGFKRFCFWLDPDKTKEAVRQALRWNTSTYKCVVIRSDADPKETSDTDIIKLVESKHGEV